MDAGLQRALYGVAAELQLLAFESDITQIYEADLRAAMRRSLHVATGRRVVPEAKIAIPTWPRAGTVDIAVRSAKGSGWDALVELKVWKQPSKIFETGWDAWKLASAYKANIGWRAYLVAAGPESIWRGEAPGLAYWKGLTLRAPDAWAEIASWPSTKPTELPAGIKTHSLDPVAIHTPRGEDWRVGAIRISTTSGRPWKPTS